MLSLLRKIDHVCTYLCRTLYILNCTSVVHYIDLASTNSSGRSFISLKSRKAAGIDLSSERVHYVDINFNLPPGTLSSSLILNYGKCFSALNLCKSNFNI